MDYYSKIPPFCPTDLPISLKYKVNVIQQSTLGSIANQNSINYKITKERIILRDNKLVNYYHLKVVHRKASSNHPLHMLQNEIACFKTSLFIKPDKYGSPLAILNLKELYEKWEIKKGELGKKYKHLKNIDTILKEANKVFKDKALFLSAFLESNLAQALFPALYGETIAEVQKRTEKKTFTSFIGNTELPLLLNVTDYQKTREAKGLRHHIKRTGTLDKKNYDAKKVKEFLARMAKGTAQTKTELKVDYQELFDLDKNYWITNAGLLFRAEIKGLFHFQQIIRVRPLTEEN